MEERAGYHSLGARITMESSMRIVVECTGEWEGFGSAVAVSSRHALTARHVVTICEGARFLALLPDGRAVWMVEDMRAARGDLDAARLVVDGSDEPFKVWATTRARDPKLGETVCSYTGGGPDKFEAILAVLAGGPMTLAIWEEPFVYKCGGVARYSPGAENGLAVKLGGGSVGGNSGSGIFDADGYLVALLVEGTTQGETVGRGPLAQDFPELFPPYSPDMKLAPTRGRARL